MTDTPPYRTKLIEVGLPLNAINKAAMTEKSIKHGHPSTLHLYWARRPLATCRAVLFSSMVDDPSADPVYSGKTEEEIQQRRQELHELIKELVLWENTSNDELFDRAKAEIASSLSSFEKERGSLNCEDWPGLIERTATKNLVNRYLAEVAPPVLDPFAGGGSLPLEAQRFGLRAFASDLNPLAVLLNKALIEMPQKFAGQNPINPEAKEIVQSNWKGASGLANDLRYYGKLLHNEFTNQLGTYYQQIEICPIIATDRSDLQKYINQKLTVIGWIWARSVESPNPIAKQKHVPLLSSFWLSKKKNKKVWVEPVIDSTTHKISFRFKRGEPDGYDPSDGTIGRGSAKCIITNTPIDMEYIRQQGREGKLKNFPIAIVLQGKKERLYIPFDENQIEIADMLIPDDIPLTDIPEKGLGIRVSNYGLDQHWKLFTPRQLNAINTYSNLLPKIHSQIILDNPNADREYADALIIYLSFVINRLANRGSTLSAWNKSAEKIEQVFGRQCLGMVWDFCESNPCSNSTGNWLGQLDWPAKVLECLPFDAPIGVVKQEDATFPTTFPTPMIISTDPPYYDNIGYANLSDFFYIWLRKHLSFLSVDCLSTLQTPKSNELVASPHMHQGDRKKADEFFETGLRECITEMRNSTCPNIPITIFYAFKQSETTKEGTVSTGWATFLEGIVNAGLSVTATMPMRTEVTVKLKKNVNALSTSVVLACRPRAIDAPITTRNELINEMKTNLERAVTNLQNSSISPVDLQQAAIGPGISTFSKYQKVIEADGTSMTIRAALALVNQVLDNILVKLEGDFDPETRFAIVWFEQHAFDRGDFGTAEVLATAKAVSVKGVEESGILESTSGFVRIFNVKELQENWEPRLDRRITIWEITHYLYKALDSNGIESAADLLRRVGPLANSAKDLAYRLFSICDKNKWSTEAQPYNELVTAWPDIQHLAAQESAVTTKEENASLFE